MDIFYKIYNRIDRILKTIKQYDLDKNASLSLLSLGLSSQAQVTPSTTVIDRIINAYQLTKKEINSIPEAYKESGAWNSHIYDKRRKYIDALDRKDAAALSRLFQDFYRNGGISGMVEYAYYDDLISGTRLQQKSFINNVLNDYYILTELEEDINLDRPKIGNPWGYVINDTLIPSTACRHYYYAKKISRLIDDINFPIVCEIGGGFGGMAYYLLRDSDTKYIDFDLPEILPVIQCYLMTAFPEKRVLLYGEDDINNIREYDIALLPNFSLPSLPDDSIDLFFNSGSLSEMSRQTVDEYISRVARVTKRYFMHENSDKEVKNSDNHTEIRASDFPIPDDMFKMIGKNKRMFGGAGDRYMEYLYRKI